MFNLFEYSTICFKVVFINTRCLVIKNIPYVSNLSYVSLPINQLTILVP
jgi:hypothetical protein